MPKPKTKAIETAFDTLCEAQESLMAAFEEVVSTIDLAPLAKAMEAYYAASEAFTDVARQAQEDASTYFDDRSERWQDSERGQAYAEYRDRLEELAAFDPAPTGTLNITIDVSAMTAQLETDPCDIFPEILEPPALE
jgi:hypothetical protein